MTQGSQRQSGRAVLDQFSYVIVYAPDFPEEDATSIEQELSGLADGVKQLRQRSQDETSIHWLGLALADIERARESFVEGCSDAGSLHLQTARDYVRRAFDKKRAAVRFVTDEQGQSVDVSGTDSSDLIQ
jgi:hypothetical protein